MNKVRLLNILAELSCGKVKAIELANKFGCSLRTIQRDIEELQNRGYDIAAEIGKTGGYYLNEDVQIGKIKTTLKNIEEILGE